MRSIKFRGKSVYSGKWRFGTLADISNKNLPVIKTDEGDEFKVDSVGQFTGLLDSEYNEIYEGDIIKWSKDDKLYVVVFRDGMFYASIEECNKDIYGGFPLHVLINSSPEDGTATIVGNIYDNSDLVIKLPNKVYLNSENNIWSPSFSDEFCEEYVLLSAIWKPFTECPDFGKQVLYYFDDGRCILDFSESYSSMLTDGLFKWLYVDDII